MSGKISSRENRALSRERNKLKSERYRVRCLQLELKRMEWIRDRLESKLIVKEYNDVKARISEIDDQLTSEVLASRPLGATVITLQRKTMPFRMSDQTLL